MNKPALICIFLSATAFAVANPPGETPTPASVAPVPAAPGESKGVTPLEALLQKYHVPALGGAIVDSTGVKLISVAGVRKRGETARVSIDDVWHLGSDTKAVTATMIAALVEQGKLSWDSKLAGVFPDLRLPGQAGSITLLQLLTHRAGLPHDADWGAISKTGSLVQQRKAAVGALASVTLMSSPGSQYSYSNLGYVIAGAMAEQVTGKSYEELMQSLIFGPLQMKSAGFGAGGTPGSLDEPWGHGPPDGKPRQYDNPLVIAPAGCMHCSLEDWGKFIADHLRGAEGKPALLKPESYARLHSAPFGGTYALGWVIADPSWGKGDVLWHSGSNGFNMALVSIAPGRDIALLAVCNAGVLDPTSDPRGACDEVGTQLMALASLPDLSPFSTAGGTNPAPAQSNPIPAGAAHEIKLDDAHSDPIVGDYTLGPGMKMVIARESGSLFMEIVGPGRPPQKNELGATSDTEFFLKRGGAWLSFVKGPDGKVTGVILRQKSAPDQHFPKAQESPRSNSPDSP
jgi:CubicO group peptidase (beta-lactamase class C family)